MPLYAKNYWTPDVLCIAGWHLLWTRQIPPINSLSQSKSLRQVRSIFALNKSFIILMSTQILNVSLTSHFTISKKKNSIWAKCLSGQTIHSMINRNCFVSQRSSRCLNLNCIPWILYCRCDVWSLMKTAYHYCLRFYFTSKVDLNTEALLSGLWHISCKRLTFIRFCNEYSL